MRRLLLLVFVLFISIPARATNYFLSATGNDGADGLTSGTAWLSPNHPVNCGDVILAAGSTSYSRTNFANGKWGTVTCAGGNNIAWLKCELFDTCKIVSPSGDGMFIDKSYWGVQGWEVNGQTGPASCFIASGNGGAAIHHIIFANNIANGCQNAGFNVTGGGSDSADYVAFVGNIAYRTAQNSGTVCGQGFSIYNPIKSDSVAGTHMYVAGNFGWDNVDNAACNPPDGPTDGDGMELDVWDGTGGSGTAYDQQALVENNIFVHNGGFGIITLRTSAARVYIRQNTLYGNMRDTHIGNCGEYMDSSPDSVSGGVTLTMNIAATNQATCHGDATPSWAYATGNSPTNVDFDSGIAYSAAGNNCGPAYGPNDACPGNGLSTGTNPAFVNNALPGAPSCGAFASVPACMASLIANFTPTAGGMSTYGYQIPGPSRVDSLFPAWLCNVNLPTGLVTPGCGVLATGAGKFGGTARLGGGSKVQ